MRKHFPLRAEGKDDARVRDKIRHEVNKYVRRERDKELPEGFTWWDFSCRVGADEAGAETLALQEVGAAIDRVAEGGAASVFIEIAATAGLRSRR